MPSDEELNALGQSLEGTRGRDLESFNRSSLDEVAAAVCAIPALIARTKRAEDALAKSEERAAVLEGDWSVWFQPIERERDDWKARAAAWREYAEATNDIFIGSLPAAPKVEKARRRRAARARLVEMGEVKP